jgi:sugar O-acyltransferase (sialic acid O-acetyltransferase NeuD family)
MSNGLVVLGVGGHARSVGDIALACGHTELLFVDAMARAGETILGFACSATLPDTLAPGWHCFPASGDARARSAQFDAARARRWPIATLVSPLATVRTDAKVGTGALVAHHAYLGPCVDVAEGCIINTAAVVDHESRIGAFTHISVNTSIAGRVDIGSFCFIGMGASVIDRLTICDRVIVGAGAAVVGSIAEPGTWVGVPASKTR